MMRRLGVPLLGLMLAGCDDINLTQFTRQQPPLTRFETEPPGDNCLLGGERVTSGLDLDGNGLLSDGEVVETRYTCTRPPPAWLTRASPAPPSDTCPLGGVNTYSGLDVDGDGELSDLEATHERLDCAGVFPVMVRTRLLEVGHPACAKGGSMVEAGPDLDGDTQLDDLERRTMAPHCGVPPGRVLVREEREPVGGRCVAGGTRIISGDDTNFDGILAEHEVLARRTVCLGPPVLDADFVPTTEEDFALLETLFRIEGSLILFRTPREQLVLPRLAEVTGRLSISENAALKRLELDALRFVGGEVEVFVNLALEVLRFGAVTQPAPVWMEQSLSVWNNPKLASLDGMRSARPRVSVFLAYNDSVQSLVTWELTELTGSLGVSGNPSLSWLPFQNLQLVGDSLSIDNNQVLTSMSFPELMEVRQGLSIHGNPALNRLTGLPVLRQVQGTFLVSDNEALHTIDPLPGLNSVGSLLISSNPRLEALDFSRLQFIDIELVVFNNPKLTKLGSFPRLESLFMLTLERNEKMTDVSGLDHIRSLGSLDVKENASLESLSGLGRLYSVMRLDIHDNPRLRRLELDAMAEVGLTLNISKNPLLPSCLAHAFADRVFRGETRTVQDNDDQATCPPPLRSEESVAAGGAAAGDDAT